jgi:hypothetical protein
VAILRCSIVFTALLGQGAEYRGGPEAESGAGCDAGSPEFDVVSSTQYRLLQTSTGMYLLESRHETGRSPGDPRRNIPSLGYNSGDFCEEEELVAKRPRL